MLTLYLARGLSTAICADPQKIIQFTARIAGAPLHASRPERVEMRPTIQGARLTPGCIHERQGFGVRDEGTSEVGRARAAPHGHVKVSHLRSRLVQYQNE